MKDSSFGEVKDYKTFAEKVIVILKSRKIKYTDLAEAVGEKVSTVKQILYGNRKPKRNIAEKICNKLDLDFYEMTKDDPYFNFTGTTFGTKLANELSIKSISHSDFAEKIGVSMGTMSHIINDKTDVKKDNLIKICGLLNLDVCEMIKDDPKYAYLEDYFSNNTTVRSLFRKVGIDKPVDDYQDILVNLINENKELFLSNEQKVLNSSNHFDKDISENKNLN